MRIRDGAERRLYSSGDSDGQARPSAKAYEVGPDDPEQSKRFIDMAREVQAEGSKEEFEKAFKKVAKEKPKGRAANP